MERAQSTRLPLLSPPAPPPPAQPTHTTTPTPPAPSTHLWVRAVGYQPPVMLDVSQSAKSKSVLAWVPVSRSQDASLALCGSKKARSSHSVSTGKTNRRVPELYRFARTAAIAALLLKPKPLGPMGARPRKPSILLKTPTSSSTNLPRRVKRVGLVAVDIG